MASKSAQRAFVWVGICIAIGIVGCGQKGPKVEFAKVHGAVLVNGHHGYNLPVALIDTVRSEVYFCFCHPAFMHETQEQGKLRCGSALFVARSVILLLRSNSVAFGVKLR